jgi:hypothetical protein
VGGDCWRAPSREVGSARGDGAHALAGDAAAMGRTREEDCVGEKKVAGGGWEKNRGGSEKWPRAREGVHIYRHELGFLSGPNGLEWAWPKTKSGWVKLFPE